MLLMNIINAINDGLIVISENAVCNYVIMYQVIHIYDKKFMLRVHISIIIIINILLWIKLI